MTVFTALAKRDRVAGDAAALRKARFGAWGGSGAAGQKGAFTRLLAGIEAALAGVDR